jgi:hypothetical protein
VIGLGASLPKLPPQLSEEPHEANTVFTPGDSCETGLEGKRRAAKHGLGGPGIPGVGGATPGREVDLVCSLPWKRLLLGKYLPEVQRWSTRIEWLLNRSRTQATPRGTEAASALRSDSRQEGIGVPGGQTSYRGPCLTPPYPVWQALNRAVAWPPSDALVFGVNDRPSQSLHELCCRVVVAEMISANELIKQYALVWAFALLSRHDDSGHTPSLSGSYRAFPRGRCPYPDRRPLNTGRVAPDPFPVFVRSVKAPPAWGLAGANALLPATNTD